jgi:hypothetical protein
MRTLIVFMSSMSNGGHFEEDKSKESKYQRLYQSHKKLETEEWQRSDIWHEEGDNDQEYLTGKDVSKQPKGEGNDLG